MIQCQRLKSSVGVQRLAAERCFWYLIFVYLFFFLIPICFFFPFRLPSFFSFLFDYSLSSSLCCLLNKSNFCKFKAVHKIAWEYLKKKEIKGCAPHLAHCQSHFFTQKILLKLLCYLNINFFKFLNVMLPILMCR